LLEQDLLMQFKWEYGILFPQSSMEEYSFQFYETEHIIPGVHRSAIVSAINRKHLRLIRNFAQKNGFTLIAVDYAHFTCDCTLLFNYQPKCEGFNLSLFLDDRRVSLELLHQGKPVYYRSKRFANFSEIADLLSAEIDLLRAKFNQITAINNAFAFGDPVTPVLLETWEQTTGIHFSPVNPFKKLTISSKLAESKLLREHFYTFAAASGICMRLA
jgi:hypothetical protein